MKKKSLPFLTSMVFGVILCFASAAHANPNPENCVLILKLYNFIRTPDIEQACRHAKSNFSVQCVEELASRLTTITHKAIKGAAKCENEYAVNAMRTFVSSHIKFTNQSFDIVGSVQTAAEAACIENLVHRYNGRVTDNRLRTCVSNQCIFM